MTTFREEVIEKMSALVAAAFGLVAALAWNGAIQEIFRVYFGEAGSIPAMIGYAIFVTILAVIAIILIGRASARAKGARRE
jgi:hypothetical protein